MVLLMTKHPGKPEEARKEFGEVFKDRLAPGQALPTKKTFKRNEQKFHDYHTIADLVIFNIY